MSASRERDDDDDDDVLSDVEPLPPSTLHQPLLTRSWPSSPRSCLYRSLQGVKGHTAARQVSFTSPDLTALRRTAELEETLDSSSHGVIGSELQETESEVESERDGLSQEKRLNESAQIKSGRRHIEEMENVRTHLQSILRSTPSAVHRHETEAPASHNLLDQSHDSDSTSHLISAAVSGMDELFPLYSRLHVDMSSSVSELQVLRDSLERERSRRKVCEQQVASLQNKVLQVQQQFTLAVAADRKKDIMIEQLDKTLVKVVEGWRKHDKDRSEEMKLLQEEKQTLEKTLNKQTETLSHVEESLNKEQKHNQELQCNNTKLEQQVSELQKCVKDLQHLEQKLNSDVRRERERFHTLQTESHNTQVLLQEQIQQIQRQITQTTQELEREKCHVKKEVILREESQSRSQQLQEDLKETRQERDSLRVERALDQTRFESLKCQMEADFHLSLEQKLNDQLSVIQEENRTLNTQLREQHRKQLLDLNTRHERDRSTQLDQFKTQLQEKDHKLQHLTNYYQNKLSEMQDELVSMAASKRRLEMQREDVVSRLQGMMRSHWAEALRLLTNQEQMESVFVAPSHWDDSKIFCSPEETSRSDTHLPAAQAVVLNLSRERVSERETQTHRGADPHSDVLNCTNSFTPLEPVLDNTHLTAVSDCSALWVGPVIAERGNSTERRMKKRNEEMRESQQNSSHSQCEHHSRAFTETQSNHSSDSGLVKGEALNEDRQNELQYYVSKLLERSPGDPLEEPIREQQAVTDPLRTHTTQQLQEIQQSFSRSGEDGVNTLKSNLKHKSNDKTEVTVSSQCIGSRVVPIRRPVDRRGASQRVWR